jgi:hypothetical protein
VRIDAPQMLFSAGQGWDIGPHITLTASCYQSSGTTHLDLYLLNNAPGTGEWDLGVLGGPGPTNPAMPREWRWSSIRRRRAGGRGNVPSTRNDAGCQNSARLKQL